MFTSLTTNTKINPTHVPKTKLRDSTRTENKSTAFTVLFTTNTIVIMFTQNAKLS